jgi:hypothetical protein
MSRPIEYTPERLEEIRQAMDEYTERTEIPILAEFAYQNKIRRQAMYEHKELTDSIKNMMAKKEAQLERTAMDGDIPAAFAIFSLKQLGWRDKQDIELSGNKDKPIRMVSISEIMEGDEFTS